MSYTASMTITHQTVMGEDGKPSAVLIPWDQFEIIREELEDMAATPEEEEAIAETESDIAAGNDDAFTDFADLRAEFSKSE